MAKKSKVIKAQKQLAMVEKYSDIEGERGLCRIGQTPARFFADKGPQSLWSNGEAPWIYA